MKKIALLGLLALEAFSQQPKFGLADIHVSATPRWFVGNYEKNGGARISGRIVDGRYIVRDASLLTLIEAAYGVTDEMVAGGPSWLGLDLYDVVAKVPGGTTQATANLMLQSLLAERFGLVTRTEMRPLPRFVLGVSKGGSKLKPAAKSEDSGCRQQLAGPMPTGLPVTPSQIPNLKMSCHNVTTQQMIDNLRQMAGGPVNTYLPREVVDSTGLQRKWDFELEFTPIGFAGDKGPDGVTLFDAVNKQLGLTLELKDVPVPALAIEKVNRNPTPNAAAAKTDLALAAVEFEVASIKPIGPNERFFSSGNPTQVKFVGTLRTLITQAFMITPNSASDVIIGLPKSADSQPWEVTAKLPSTGEGALIVSGARPMQPQRSLVMEMLRNLLASQFGLKTHSENREVTVYAMTQKSKPKMEKGNPAERAECHVDPTAVKPYPNMGTMVTCRNYTVAAYAEDLNQVTGSFDHPIVDASGLKGGWNFSIGWSRDQAPPNQVANGQASDPTGLTPYEAVERLMGLKLVKQKRSIPVIVVDHVEEKPLE